MCAQRRFRSAWASALIRVFAVRMKKSSLSAWRKLGSWDIHWAHSKDSDQTGWMSRLIWVFPESQSFCWFCHEANSITSTHATSIIPSTHLAVPSAGWSPSHSETTAPSELAGSWRSSKSAGSRCQGQGHSHHIHLLPAVASSYPENIRRKGYKTYL